MDLADRYAALKESMSLATGASEDLLHVHFGLLIFVVMAVLLGKRLHSRWPLLGVAAFAIGNEMVDIFASEWQPIHSILDVANTLFWPTILFLVASRRRGKAERDLA